MLFKNMILGETFMKQKQLLISKPLVSCYPQHAFYLSILANQNEALPWIYFNYNNIFIDKNGFIDFIVKTPEYFLYPWFQGSQRLHKDIIKVMDINISDFLKKNIIENYYIWLHIDEFYLPVSAHYLKRHFHHAIFITGFDDEKNVFNVGGYYNLKGFSFKQVSFQDLKQAFVNSNNTYDFHSYIHLIKLNENYQWENDIKFNLELLKKNLINNINSSFDYSFYIEENYNLNHFNNLSTGISVYDVLIDLLNKGLIEDHRSLFVLYEHKKITNAKFIYLKNNRILNLSDNIYNQLEEIERKSQIILTLFLKFTISKKTTDIKKIIEYLYELKDHDIKVSKLIVEAL